MFAHLHARSWFSFLAGGSSPAALAERAASLGMEALAITDVNGVYGAVRFAQACREHGIRPIYGAEVPVVSPDGQVQPIVLLAPDNQGYGDLCKILTAAHLHDREQPAVTPGVLSEHARHLFCLSGGRGSYLWTSLDKERPTDAERWVGMLREMFRERLSVEVAHHLRPGDGRRVGRLARLSARTGVPLLATGDVRHATPDHYRRYDLLTCIREGITVFDPHEARPVNAEAHLKSEAALARLIPHPEAFARAAEVAASCHVDLLPGSITPPGAKVPDGWEGPAYLRDQCEKALPRKYPSEKRTLAREHLEKELAVIFHLDIQEFFLVVQEVVKNANSKGIRCAGRGSAANSIVAYLLGITGVDPLAHNLLFERFLHTGRIGTPDIDVDFDSARRGEVIAWMEDRFGIEQTAMTANVNTYRLRSALGDTAKALGWSPEEAVRLSKAVVPGNASRALECGVEARNVLGDSPLVGILLQMAAGLDGCPRHLSLHSGGMVLSRPPLWNFSPVQISANGVRQVQFDKDDVEALGLVKLDVLGLRMMAALSEADELVKRCAFDKPGDADASGYPHHTSLDDLPLDDADTFDLIRAGQTLGCFQIESQGQLHLLAQHQPEDFNDLITEIALFRPGPLQGNMVHPFVRRRRGLEPVQYPHPSLEPVLRDTYGIILFQEQVLEVAHQFAGMSLTEADEFRKLMSKFRDPGEMELMRGRFVSGAMKKGVPEATANLVFDRVAKFVGYGFCRSHAAAFAKTVYQSCYLKRHHPAAYMAAVMQHRPGMYNLQSLQEEARRMGAQTLPPHVVRSDLRYTLEHSAEGALVIRMPLTAVAGLSEDDARALVFERGRTPFTSLEDFYTRVSLPSDVMDLLARSGALDELRAADGAPLGDARRALWEVGVLRRRLGQAGHRPSLTLFSLPTLETTDVPELQRLAQAERIVWDLQAHDAGRHHPMALLRRSLSDLEIRPIETCYHMGEALGLKPGGPKPLVTIAGLCVLRQRPPTANGVVFLLLEDETGFIQCIVRPSAQEHMDHILKSSAIIARGQLLAERNWRGLLLIEAWHLQGAIGGYSGHLSMGGGLDSRIVYQNAGSAAKHSSGEDTPSVCSKKSAAA